MNRQEFMSHAIEPEGFLELYRVYQKLLRLRGSFSILLHFMETIQAADRELRMMIDWGKAGFYKEEGKESFGRLMGVLAILEEAPKHLGEWKEEWELPEEHDIHQAMDHLHEIFSDSLEAYHFDHTRWRHLRRTWKDTPQLRIVKENSFPHAKSP